MFRIASDKPKPPPTDVPPPVEPTQEPPAPDGPTSQPDGPKYTAMKADPSVAGYRDPSMGPFMCSNCFHFDGQNGCNVVGGNIDPNGICNLFTTNSDQGEGEAGPDAASQEAPVAGPPSPVPPPPPLPPQG